MPNVTKICKVGSALQDIPEKYETALQELLDNRPLSTGGETDDSISVRLYKAGYQVSPNTIGRHRSGRCVCFRWQD